MSSRRVSISIIAWFGPFELVAYALVSEEFRNGLQAKGVRDRLIAWNMEDGNKKGRFQSCSL